MNAELQFAFGGAALVALSLFVLVAIPHLLRKLLAFNILASGIFLMLVGLGQRGGEPDPIPQALVLTGIVVSFAATALALTLMRRWFRMSGRFTLDSGIDGPTDPAAGHSTDHAGPTVPEHTDHKPPDRAAENRDDVLPLGPTLRVGMHTEKTATALSMHSHAEHGNEVGFGPLPVHSHAERGNEVGFGSLSMHPHAERGNEASVEPVPSGVAPSSQEHRR